MTDPQPADDRDAVVPGPDGLPRPVDAMAVAFDQRFIRAVAVALMRVLQDGAPDIGFPGWQMARYIAADPEGQARRFAIGLASDPDVVVAALATNDNPGEVAGGLVVLTDRVRAMWAIMAGETGDPGGGDHAAGSGGKQARPSPAAGG